MFDESTNYLDVMSRINIAKFIRSLQRADNYIIAVEHDLSILDYISDKICVFYGHPGVYGAVTVPFSVTDGINIFLEGSIPSEDNYRFRNYEI